MIWCFIRITIKRIEKANNVVIFDSTNWPECVQMHVEIEPWDFFFFTDNDKPFENIYDLIILVDDLLLFFFLTHHIIPFQKQKLVPVADIIEIVDSEALKLNLNHIFLFLLGILRLRLRRLYMIDVVAVIKSAFGWYSLKSFGEFTEHASKQS